MSSPAVVAADRLIVCEDLSKLYGDVLGVNRVNLTIPPGITSLVGPNGAGKTTLLNLLTGLVRPSRGKVTVLGVSTDDPERLFRMVGYCTQFDAFPRRVTGEQFVYRWLLLHGLPRAEARKLTAEAIERVGMTAAARRRVAGYSKGMRQRIRLAQAISHHPRVLVLDEPLNGLDPMARAEVMSLFQDLGRQGMHVLISSHILHEVDRVSDQVVLLSGGYVVAEGRIHGVREEMTEHPIQVLVRCSHPNVLASRVFALDHVVEAKIVADGRGVLVRTRDADGLYRAINRIVTEEGLDVEAVAPADEDVNSLYRYLIGAGSETS
jgi:ABC-2 type transport system ATP-binding protein